MSDSTLLGVVHISNVPHAVNLLWNQVSTGESPIKVAKKSAKIIGTDLVCLENSVLGAQYGLADKSVGHKAGMRVLATKLDYSAGSLCGAWEFDGGIWVVIAINRDGLILLDKGLSEESLAIDELSNMLYSGDWDRIICPDDWNVSNSINIPLDNLYGRKKSSKIRTTNSFPKIAGLFFLFFIGSISLYIGLTFYGGRQDDVEVELAPTSQPKVIEEVDAKIIAPWSDLPKPLSMITQCMKNINLNILNAASVPGWEWDDEAYCDDKKVFFPIKKNGGTALWLQSANQLIFPAPDINNITTNSAVLSWKIPDIETYNHKELIIDEMNSISSIKKFLTESFSQSFTSISFGSTEKNDRIIKTTFNYSTKQEPGIYLPILIKIEGIVITRIDYLRSGDWKVSGEFWGKENE